MTTTDRKARPRNRKSAKRAGAQLEIGTAGILATYVNPDITRQRLTGQKDLADIANVRLHQVLGSKRVAVECKNEAGVHLGTWAGETERERVNLGAVAGVSVSKRHGKADPLEQWVHMTMRDFIAILTGVRPV